MEPILLWYRAIGNINCYFPGCFSCSVRAIHVNHGSIKNCEKYYDESSSHTTFTFSYVFILLLSVAIVR